MNFTKGTPLQCPYEVITFAFWQQCNIYGTFIFRGAYHPRRLRHGSGEIGDTMLVAIRSRITAHVMEPLVTFYEQTV